ncbi:mannosyl-3-phosphoglycerate synthase [Methanosarcinales archaeon]|nr:MAG: mannosyl-3-phosphoglycerate synthase [Methanosarcinales archaeon]
MLLEIPRHTEIFGSLKLHELQRVIKLDSGNYDAPHANSIPRDALMEVLRRSAMIIPIKNEKIHLLDGVLRAVPHDTTIIIVSNSSREPQDRYKMEKDVVKRIAELTGQEIIMIHQKDDGLAIAFHDIGYKHILDDNMLVRDGKAEGMIIGILIAKAIGKGYVGFIDADNYIPGSVNEYVLDYAAGFCMSKSPYCMVRLAWRYKPKVIEERLYFRKWGRVSESTNKYLNMLLSVCTNFETGIIKTGNAGEHAMTMKLAEILQFSTGYSIEPYQFVYLFEEFGLCAQENSSFPDAVKEGVEIFQIETLNPHIHEEKGEEHITNMLLASLSTIYHSRICSDFVREGLMHEIEEMTGRREMPEENLKMPPIGNIDADLFMKIIESSSDTFKWFSAQTSSASHTAATFDDRESVREVMEE